MNATIENMREHYAPNVFAFSWTTGEKYGANPADYWNVEPGWTMLDELGEPMVLVTKETTVTPL